jgi:hypothetical protein
MTRGCWRFSWLDAGVKALVIVVGFVVAYSGKTSGDKPVNHGPRTQITYEIDLDIAIDDRAAEIRRDIEAGFADEKVAASVRTPATPVGALTIVPADGPTKIVVQEQLKPKYADTVTPRECPVTDGPDALCFAIRGGRAAITMGGNDRRRQELERDELVNVLRTGSLPAPLREASVRELR